MATRPQKIPSWATTLLYAVLGKAWDSSTRSLDPGSPAQADGWTPAQRPNARVMNWLFNLIGQWLGYFADVQIRNWFSRTAPFVAVASVGISSLQRAIYDDNTLGTPQILVIGSAGGGNAPPAMASLTGDGWLDASAGMTGTNYGNYDGVYCVGDGVDLWIIVGDNKIHTHPRDLSGGVWTSRAPADVSNWKGIAHGPGLGVPIVIVGTSGKINTTANGTVWTSRASGTAQDLLAICWAPGPALYVAVGVGAIVTSPDGITWTGRVSGTGANIVGVAWDPRSNKLVAVTHTGVVITSPDGVTWSSAGPLTPPTNNIYRVSSDGAGMILALYPGNGTFATGAFLWFTLDGAATWTRVPLDYSGNAYGSVAWCDRLGWLAVGPNVAGGPAVSLLQSVRL